MTRRLGLLAALLAALTVATVACRVDAGGWSFGWGGPAPQGPPVPGARGELLYIRGGDVWTYDLERGVERRVTQTGGARFPRWSATGQWISVERGGRLWIMKRDGSGAFAAPGGDVPASARWAPRGTRIVYTSADGSLSLLDPTLGERGRRILVPPGNGAGPHVVWSHDTTRLAYERHQPAGQNNSSEGIWIINTLGRDANPIFLTSGDFSLEICCWLITDDYVLLWRGTRTTSVRADGAPLFIARTDSGSPIPISTATLLYRDWLDSSPRFDAIAFVAGGGREATAGKSLMLAGLPRGATNAAAAGVSTIVADPALAPASPRWAPMGGEIAYSVGPSLEAKNGDLAATLAGRRIDVIQPDGTEKRSLLSEATVPAGVSDERPQWSRDGRTLVFVRRLQPEQAARTVSGQAPGEVEIWVATADGSSARRAVGGLPDPGIGYFGHIDWEEVFEYRHS